MNVESTAIFDENFKYWVQHDKKITNKLLKLISAIKENPIEGIGKPEPLKHEFSGCWSRRINREHRIVYRMKGNVIQFLSCRYHYPS